MRVAIMDTTLRDGEQTPDISYTASEKLHVARMLLSTWASTVSRLPLRASRVASLRRRCE